MRDQIRLAVVLIVVGIVLRLGFLGADSFWLDEAFSVTRVLEHSAGDVWADSPDPNHPSLYFVILLETLRLVGTSEAAARLPSALASIGNLGLLFVLARRLNLTRDAAASAVVLLALAPVDVWYAQEARMYELVTTAGLVFAVFLTMDSLTGAALTWVALTVGLYLDFTMVPLSAALTTLWLIRWWQTSRAPWQLMRVVVATAVAWWCFRPLWAHLGQVVNRVDTVPLFVNLRDWFSLHLRPGVPAIVVLVLMNIGLVIVTLVISIGLRRDRFTWWWSWLVGTTFVVCTAALAAPRGYSAKQYLVIGWPFVILFTVWTMTAFTRRWFPVAVGVSLMAAVITVATPRADWRGVVAYLNQRTPAPQAVWIDPGWNSIPYDYYHPTIAAVTNPLDSTESNARRNGPGADVCLIAQRYGKTPPTSPSEAWLDAHSHLVGVVPFARLEVRCYRQPSPPTSRSATSSASSPAGS